MDRKTIGILHQALDTEIDRAKSAGLTIQVRSVRGEEDVTAVGDRRRRVIPSAAFRFEVAAGDPPPPYLEGF